MTQKYEKMKGRNIVMKCKKLFQMKIEITVFCSFTVNDEL